MRKETIKVCGVLASSANNAEITDGTVSPTLMARAGTGGNQLPLVAYKTAKPKVYAIENHPNDSRARIDPNGIVQTLSSRMGTGGNNTPFVLIENKSPVFINSSGGGISTTIDASYYKGQGLSQGIDREYVVMIDESILDTAESL